MNSTPSANRIHIGFFGKRNAGKSSVVNAVTGQELSIVSEVKGTTTDPVTKAMELLPLGPVLIIDTPGYDDEGMLGEQRVRKTRRILNKTDIAILVVDATVGLTDSDFELIEIFKEKKLDYLVVYNKSDLIDVKTMIALSSDDNAVLVSATHKKNIEQLKEKIGLFAKSGKDKYLVRDLVSPEDIVILVTPIDSSAPKGRIILPQQQVIRDLLDSNCITMVVQVNELSCALNSINRKPRMIITDSQVFSEVSNIVPDDITLTSFSILMARFKGFLESAVNGARSIDKLCQGDKILICEGCTHHRQCEDIGTVKLPAWLETYTGKKFDYEFTSGGSFPDDLSPYSVIIHCGGCTLNERELTYRMKCAEDQNVPFTNYGTVIALTQGILERSIKVFDL